MATRKPSRAASRGKSKAPARPPARPAAAKAKKTAAKKTASRRTPAAPRRKQRRTDPETLRLRSIEPTLTVDDLDRSLRFYTEVLGFIVGERWTDKGVLLGVMLKAGACEIGLSQDDWKKGRDRKKGEGMRLLLETVQDIDALAARIKKAGGELTEEPKDQSWGGRTLAVADPDGFLLTIYREAAPKG
jgi:catechol 2,3-dioxygenase-like lactoylglutathione lyase family enzyme